ncbi:MAG: hypothetical protein GY705_21035 [Bacteroidetes bacterium]|nr:hypothetical protein [Bacteroidota bacterium]
MTNGNSGGGSMSPKVIAIIAHVTIIGWIVALILNNQNRSSIATYYIRQTLGIYLILFAARFVMIVPFIGWLAGMAGIIVAFILWIISLLGAVNDEEKEVPYIGDKFQEWFHSL